MKKFDYTLDFQNIDFRAYPNRYIIGKGEQGVLLVEPYKSEILPFWRFKTREIAQESAEKIYSLFQNYKKNQDFVGMDMARKFLQMGYTRSRRYANHSSGKKYSDELKSHPQDIKNIPYYRSEKNKKHFIDTKTKAINPVEHNFLTNEKAQSAKIFYEYYTRVKNDKEYQQLKIHHQQNIENNETNI